MSTRLGQVARHLSRPLPTFAHGALCSAAASRARARTSTIMAAATATPGKGLIHTAACLIIGDEVLGGKVCTHASCWLHCVPANALQDCRYELGAPSIVLARILLIVQAYFAKFCFSLGINLRRIEVIADDEGEIVEAVRRMSTNYDLVVTSGGIGPT